MKVEVIEGAPTTSVMVKHDKDDIIVWSTDYYDPREHFRGVVIKDGRSQPQYVSGEYVNGWVKSNFQPLPTGTIIQITV